MQSDYAKYVMGDLLLPVPEVTVRKMFGGYGLYQTGIIFGMIIEDELYFKVDQTNQADYELLGSEPFTYHKNSKPYKMGYWKVPSEFLDNQELLIDAIERSVAISRSKAKPNKK